MNKRMWKRVLVVAGSLLIIGLTTTAESCFREAGRSAADVMEHSKDAVEDAAGGFIERTKELLGAD